MDEAFLPLSGLLDRARALPGALVDQNAGMRLFIDECTLAMPVELDISRRDDGSLQIGSMPPLYRTTTTFLPSFHQLRVTLQCDDDAPEPLL